MDKNPWKDASISDHLRNAKHSYPDTALLPWARPLQRKKDVEKLELPALLVGVEGDMTIAETEWQILKKL